MRRLCRRRNARTAPPRRSVRRGSRWNERPENEDDGGVGEARRITLAVVEVADNPQSELSAQAVTVSELNGKKIARTIECVAHDPQAIGIIDRPDSVRWCHFPLLFSDLRGQTGCLLRK
jgi:hypothetical protein